MGGGADFDADIAGKDEGKFMFLLNLIADKPGVVSWMMILMFVLDVQEMMTVTPRMRKRVRKE